MHSASRRSVQPDRQNDNYSSVVSDLMSLIEHMQASMKMLEGAIARELPLGDQEAGDNVIVLDDITPCYVKANAALHACKAGLGVALHFLSGAEPPEFDNSRIGRKRSPHRGVITFRRSDRAWKSVASRPSINATALTDEPECAAQCVDRRLVPKIFGESSLAAHRGFLGGAPGPFFLCFPCRNWTSISAPLTRTSSQRR